MDLYRITHPLRLAKGSHQPASGKGGAMNAVVTAVSRSAKHTLAKTNQGCIRLLAGLGVTELSMAPGVIPEVKAALRQVPGLEAAREAARAAMETADGAEARALGLALLR